MHGHLRPVIVVSLVDRLAVLIYLFGFRVFTFTLQLYSRPVEYVVKGMHRYSYSKTMSGRSNCNIAILSGVRSLEKYRKDGTF